MIRVVLAEDDPALHELVAEVLAATPDMRLVAGVENGGALCPLLAHTPADVVLLNMILPGLGGLALLPLLRRDWPQLPVVMFTSNRHLDLIRRAAAAGAAGYVVKQGPWTDLVAAIRTVVQGGRHISPQLGEEAARLFLNPPPAAGPPASPSGPG